MSEDHDRVSRRRLLTGVGAAGVTALAGCTGGGDGGSDGSGSTQTSTSTPSGSDDTSTATSTPESRGSLSFAQAKSPIDFDPLVSNDIPSQQIVERVFDSLYTYAEGTTLEPQIASGMPEVSQNGTRYVVPLRDDVTYHNGDALTAEDVKYSYLAPAREETENGSEFTMIDEITIVDEQTVQFDLKFPFGPFRHKLTWYPVPKSVREQDKQAFNTESPVGTGPFRFVDWQEGDYTRLEAWDDYWGDTQPGVDAIEFTPVEEPTTRVTTLRNGEHDIINTVPPKQYPVVEGIQGASVQERPGLGYYYLSFNCNEGPTSDPLVREAIDYTFSMDQAVSNYVEPSGTRQYSPLPDPLIQSWDFPIDQWQEIPHDKDLEQAQALFEEAGVPMDYQWKIIVPPDDKREQIGITVSNGLKEVGFDNVSVQRLDWGAFLDKYATGNENDYNMYTLGWVDEVDPDGYLYFMFHESEEGSTNGCYYRNDEVMDQLDQARESPDRAERKELYTEAVTTILEDRAHLPAYNLKNSFGVADRVEGFRPHTIASMNPDMVGPDGRVTLNDN